MSQKEEKPQLLEQVNAGEFEAFFYTNEDKSKLLLEIKVKVPEQKITCSKNELLNLIPARVNQGILDERVIDQALEFLEKGQNLSIRRIAKGKEVIPSRDGRILLLVKPYDTKGNKIEFVDPWYIKHFDLIETGNIVARLYPPVNGAAGIDIFGDEIPCPPGPEAKIEIDPSLEIKEVENNAYKNIVSKIPGYLLAQGNKLSVSQDLNISGDCDPQIGDLNFSGNITIKGNVMKDFSLKAKGNIEVHGDVINGFLSSSTGNITVKGYVTGNFSEDLISTGNITNQQVARFSRKFFPQIQCAGNFSGSTLDNVSLEADGLINISKEIKSSLIRTKTLINVSQGIIIGGEIYTVCGLEAKQIGVDTGTATIIHITSNIESSGDYIKLLEKIKSVESAENLLRLYLGPYADNPTSLKSLKPEHKTKMQNMQNKLNDVVQTKLALFKDKDSLLSQAKYNHVYRVNSLEKIYPGVVIISGGNEFKVDALIEGKKTIEFFPEENKFEISELKALECSFLKS